MYSITIFYGETYERKILNPYNDVALCVAIGNDYMDYYTDVKGYDVVNRETGVVVAYKFKKGE